MNIYQKLIEVRKAVPYLQKENSGNQYKYVSSSQTLSSLRAKLDEYGLLLIPKVISTNVLKETVEKSDGKKTTTYFTELTMQFTWVNAEKPEEIIACSWYGQGVDIAGEKGVGKALTYAEKYFMLKFFNIATDKDDPDSFQGKNDDPPPNKAPAPKTSAGTISEPQIKRAFAIANEANISADDVRAWVKSKYHKDDIKNLTKTEYDALCKALEAKKGDKK